MKSFNMLTAGASALLLSIVVSPGETKTVVAYNSSESAIAGFNLKNIPKPSGSDAATKAEFTIVYGTRDRNGGNLEKLHDGAVPAEEDQPSENFFFNAGTEGGRLLVDLLGAIDIKQVNTYSWHGGPRGPQVYTVFASDGKAEGFQARPPKGTEPDKSGWKRIAAVDTRPKEGEGAGQYGVSISDTEGTIGKYRYLLFDIFRTESTDPFGNTFYSEIDVIDRNAPEKVETVAAQEPVQQPGKIIVDTEGGKYQITIDTSETPELTEWATKELAPVVRVWYPKLVAMLPSEGYVAPKTASVIFSASMTGVAATGGTRVRCAATWFKANLKGEAVGAVVHELVHVVQQYGRARRTNPNATNNPGWLVEGLTDYIRWFIYEPQTHGAEITKRNIARARYDANYRISANFLNWVIVNYDQDLVRKLNTAMREGNYQEDFWKKCTGKTAPELGEEWKASMEKKIEADAKANTLTEAETAAGWQLLFNGQDLGGWHNFKRAGVRPGWQVKDASLVCVNPKNAGDIVTSNKFDWFELQIDYNISHAGNSGIIYHVTDEGGAVWATGPEIQIEDNKEAADPERCGWLYGLYKPAIDPKTNKPLDATKPVGEWNHVRILLSPEQCVHEINGVKYFEYVLHSDDFNARVAKSKFRSMPGFAKSDLGYIALQGDHGQVSFRNVKIRPIVAKK